jgi:plastocyanin
MSNRVFPFLSALPRIRAGRARSIVTVLFLLAGVTWSGASFLKAAASAAPQVYNELYSDSPTGVLGTAGEHAPTSSPQIAPLAPQTAATVGTGAQIRIKNFAFGPATTTLEAGQKLTWINDDPIPHTATAQDKQWDSGQVAPGKSFTVTITKPGIYVYTCLIHPFMQAKVIVTK